MQSGRKTLRDVAAAAGVSAATVSLALRESPRLPLATRKKVAAAARRLGYEANAALSRVMREIRCPEATRYRETLALLLPAGLEGGTRWPAWLRAGMKARAAELGYGLEEVRMTGERGEARRVTRELRARGIRGLVLGPPAGATCAYDLEWRYFAFVAIGYGIIAPRADRVARDVVHTLRGVYARLRRLGYRRIGFVSSPNNEARAEGAALATHLLARWEQGNEAAVAPLVVTRADDPGLVEWMERERPDVVLSTVLGVEDELARHGWRSPEDVGYCCFNVQGSAAPQSGIYADYEAIGAAAVEQVARLVEQGRMGEPERETALLIPGRWCAGTTLRRRSARDRAR